MKLGVAGRELLNYSEGEQVDWSSQDGEKEAEPITLAGTKKQSK